VSNNKTESSYTDKKSTGFHHLKNQLETSKFRLRKSEFEMIKTLVKDQFGINFDDQKIGLVENRIQRIIRSGDFGNFADFIRYLEKDTTKRQLSDLVDCLSTNHTYFFREKSHFDFFFSKALPEVVATLQKNNTWDLRIWCAACATGEEAYTLQMLLMEYFGNKYPFWNAGILATDISSQALDFARKGIYSADRVGMIPKSLKEKYLTRLPTGDWKVIDKIRREVTFRRFNLVNKRFPFKNQFHIIFCRNVMIYFDIPTRRNLVEEINTWTTPGGYFFTGCSESIDRSIKTFEHVIPAVYKKVPC